jgi:hypothetical protein
VVSVVVEILKEKFCHCLDPFAMYFAVWLLPHCPFIISYFARVVNRFLKTFFIFFKFFYLLINGKTLPLYHFTTLKRRFNALLR